MRDLVQQVQVLRHDNGDDLEVESCYVDDQGVITVIVRAG